MKRWIKALLPSEIVCLQKCNRSSQIKVRFHPCTGAATMGHSVEFARKKKKMKLPRTVVAVLGGFFQQALAIRAPTSSAAFATAALEFRTASCALTHRRLHSLPPYCVNMNAFQLVSATSEGLRPCGAWLRRRSFSGCAHSGRSS